MSSSSGETLKAREKQMERWAKHFSRNFKISDQVIQNIQSLPIMNELNSLPTLKELNKAIDSLACAKAPGNDAIPSKILKVGKSVLLNPLHKLLFQCWDEGSVSQDMRNASIITPRKMSETKKTSLFRFYRTNQSF